MPAIIRYMTEKLKSWLGNDQLFYGLLLILVGLGSFALGRLSVLPRQENAAPKVDFTEAKTWSTVAGDLVMPGSSQSIDMEAIGQELNNSDLTVVASRSGTKYHLLNCVGAKQIKPENLVTFSTREEAEKAGYTPAINCPGLQ